MIKEKFKFTVRDFEVSERVKEEKNEYLPIKINAVHETISRNGITYLAENLAKAAPSFNDMHVSVDHTDSARDIIGRTMNPRMEGKALKVDTKVFNTAAYPDAIEMFEKGLWKDFSIEASADIYESENGEYVAENMEFVGIAVVDIPGVKGAKRESFEEAVTHIIAERANNDHKSLESETMEIEEKLKEQKALNEELKESIESLKSELSVLKEKKPEVGVEAVDSLKEKLESQDNLINELSEKIKVLEESKADPALGGNEPQLTKVREGGVTRIFKK